MLKKAVSTGIEVVLVTIEFVLWLFIALTLFLYLADQTLYKDYLVKEIEKMIGYPIKVEGPITLAMMPFPQADLCEVSFSFMHAKKLNLIIEPLYDKRRVRIKSFDARKLEGQGFLVERMKGKTDFSKDGLKLSDFYLKHGKNEFKGNLIVNTTKKNTKITGKLSTDIWHIEPNLSDVTFNNIESNLDFSIRQLWLGKYLIQNANVKVNTDKNKMVFAPKGVYAGGDLQANIIYHAASKIPIMTFDLNLRNARPNEFFTILGNKARLQGGELSVRFQGTSRGNTVEQWKKQLSGKVLIHAKHLTMPDKKFQAAGIDLFSALLGVFFAKKPSNQIECAVIKANIVNGVAKSQQNIGLATRDLFILGSGQTNLSTLSVNYLFNVYSRHPVNFEIISFDHVVRATGTLNDPQLRLSSEGFVKGGLSAVLGFATGGISILAEKLFKIGTQGKSPCDMVLDQPF